MAEGLAFKFSGSEVDFSQAGLGRLPVTYVQGFSDLSIGLLQTEQDALQGIYDGLIADNTWSAIKAFYPMVGRSSEYHRYNFKDYRNSDLAFRLTFNNDSAEAHSNLGYLGNRALGRSANTHYLWSGTLTSTFVGVYVTVSEVADSNQRSLLGGTNNSPNTNRVLLARSFAGTTRAELANDSGGTVDGGTANRTKLGFIGVSNINGTVELWDGNTVIATASKTIPTVGGSVALQLLDYINNLTSSHSYSDAGLGSAVIATGLTKPDIVNVINRINTFNSALGR